MDLIKFSRPEQFPKDEILNNSDRLVRSWMSVEVKDKQGDIIPVDELKKVLNTWFMRGATMMDQHTNRPIGKGLRWEIKEHPETKTPGIILDYQIFDHYTLDDQVWKEIKEGKRTGLSIGGRALEKPTSKEDEYSGEMGKYIKGIELYEVSPVHSPANQFGETIAVNYLAKGDSMESPKEFLKKLEIDLAKGYAGDITKPFAQFSNFDECQAAQKERGHSDDSAKRICGWLKQRTDNTFMTDGFQQEQPQQDQSQQSPNEQAAATNEQTPENMNSPAGTDEQQAQTDVIPGGMAEGKNPEDFDPQSLAEGTQVEMEHTDDQNTAQEIAIDHLTEDPEYYRKLKTIEGNKVSAESEDDTMKSECPACKMENEILKALTEPIEKARVYLKPGQKAPEGVSVQSSPGGAQFYESQGRSPQQQQAPHPQTGNLQPNEQRLPNAVMGKPQQEQQGTPQQVKPQIPAQKPTLQLPSNEEYNNMISQLSQLPPQEADRMINEFAMRLKGQIGQQTQQPQVPTPPQAKPQQQPVPPQQQPQKPTQTPTPTRTMQPPHPQTGNLQPNENRLFNQLKPKPKNPFAKQLLMSDGNKKPAIAWDTDFVSEIQKPCKKAKI